MTAAPLAVTLVGLNAETGLKALYSVAFVLGVLLLRMLALVVIRRILGGEVADQRRFYFVILRGDVFGVGDRITLGGVRGDVVRLGFLKTTIMEMGQPPAVSAADPAVWVHSRQYTGRLVTVTNGAIFAEPVYNYTRDFPYLWEEIVLPVDYDTDRDKVEWIMLAAARAHAIVDDADARKSLARMQARYAMSDASLDPAVYLRLTDNWLELSLRFLVPARGVREVKDWISRQILAELDAAKIGLASATYDIVSFPPIRIEGEPPRPA